MLVHCRAGTQRRLRKRSSFLPIQKQPLFCCQRNGHTERPFKRCAVYLALSRGDRVSSCAGNKSLKKKISRWGGVGKKGFLLMSQNAVLEGEHAPNQKPLSLGVGTDENTDHTWDLFPSFQLAGFRARGPICSPTH